MTDIPLCKYTKIGLYATLFTSNVVDIYNYYIYHN